ncbi:MAG: peptide deformylase [Thermoanaerobaculia bacterium]
MTELPILPAGDPRLRRKASPVLDLGSPELGAGIALLHEVLERFRAIYGFGRAIAAPQLAIPLRLVAMNLGSAPLTLINPEILERSPETLTLWDDCMCFPDRLVRVERHRSISVAFLDPDGREHRWPWLDEARSELLQHEIDHLDGVLALDRAQSPEDVVPVAEFEADRERFLARVSYRANRP